MFADVAAPLITALQQTPSYVVKEVGLQSREERVDNYRAINSGTNEQDVAAEISRAEIVTTAVGPTILKFVAPVIVDGLRARADGAAPLAVMACENAINATNVLVEHMRERASPDEWETLAARAVFANTAVDRIVPGQAGDEGLDVTVETYFEWAVERQPFAGNEPPIPDATWVDDLAPYIERKLFTVNTGHAATAYHGFARGISKLSDALADPAVRHAVEGVLTETKRLLVDKHEFSPDAQQAYLEKILTRFENPYLPDTVERVGRQPLRKLSRNERLIGPAAELAGYGDRPTYLLATVDAALSFDVPEDPESVEMHRLLGSLSAAEATTRITGLNAGEPLYDDVRDVMAGAVEPRHND